LERYKKVEDKMTKPITFDIKHYFEVRSYLDSSDNFHTPKLSVGEDARVYISSFKNKDHVVKGLKLSVYGKQATISPLNGSSIPEAIRGDLENLIQGENKNE